MSERAKEFQRSGKSVAEVEWLHERIAELERQLDEMHVVLKMFVERFAPLIDEYVEITTEFGGTLPEDETVADQISGWARLITWGELYRARVVFDTYRCMRESKMEDCNQSSS